MKCKMMTAREAIERLFSMQNKTKRVDFTFDDIELDPNIEPSGWYGMKLTQIFDEYEEVFALGYWGGGCTEVYDIYNCVEEYDSETIKDFCVNKLQEFMDKWCDRMSGCDKICVDMRPEDVEGIQVYVGGGYLQATANRDVNYSGICVEFISSYESDNALSRPTVLVEKPLGEELRVLIWSDEDEEDYTTEVKFK